MTWPDMVAEGVAEGIQGQSHLASQELGWEAEAAAAWEAIGKVFLLCCYFILVKYHGLRNSGMTSSVGRETPMSISH